MQNGSSMELHLEIKYETNDWAMVLLLWLGWLGSVGITEDTAKGAWQNSFG